MIPSINATKSALFILRAEHARTSIEAHFRKTITKMEESGRDLENYAHDIYQVIKFLEERIEVQTTDPDPQQSDVA